MIYKMTLLPLLRDSGHDTKILILVMLPLNLQFSYNLIVTTKWLLNFSWKSSNEEHWDNAYNSFWRKFNEQN